MNWPVKKLGDILSTAEIFTDGNWVESKDQDVNGSIRLLQLADIGDGNFINKSNRFINENTFIRLKCTEVQLGDILIARMPDPLGRACIFEGISQKCITVVDVCIIRVDSNIVDARWLMHAINSDSVRRQISSFAKGATRVRISRKNLSHIQIEFPPLAEQQRVAELLDTADRILKLRELAIAKLDQLAQSVFLNELQSCDSSSFQLADVAEMYQPKTISANELIENGEYVVYGANGVIGRYDKFNHADSEVLVTCRGATCGTVNWSQPLAWITGNAMVVKPLNNTVTKDFLHYYFKFIADFSSVITGAAQPQITRQTLSRLPIVIPKLENQNEITNVIRKIYIKHDFMNSSKNKLHELTRALQNQSFAVN